MKPTPQPTPQPAPQITPSITSPMNQRIVIYASATMFLTALYAAQIGVVLFGACCGLAMMFVFFAELGNAYRLESSMKFAAAKAIEQLLNERSVFTGGDSESPGPNITPEQRAKQHSNQAEHKSTPPRTNNPAINKLYADAEKQLGRYKNRLQKDGFFTEFGEVPLMLRYISGQTFLTPRGMASSSPHFRLEMGPVKGPARVYEPRLIEFTVAAFMSDSDMIYDIIRRCFIEAATGCDLDEDYVGTGEGEFELEGTNNTTNSAEMDTAEMERLTDAENETIAAEADELADELEGDDFDDSDFDDDDNDDDDDFDSDDDDDLSNLTPARV